MSGMTEGLLWVLCHAPATPYHGPLPQGERETGATLSCPPAPLCHSRRSPSVIPAGPPLSFPPVVSGNPVSFFSVLYLCGPPWGKPWIPD